MLEVDTARTELLKRRKIQRHWAEDTEVPVIYRCPALDYPSLEEMEDWSKADLLTWAHCASQRVEAAAENPLYQGFDTNPTFCRFNFAEGKPPEKWMHYYEPLDPKKWFKALPLVDQYFFDGKHADLSVFGGNRCGKTHCFRRRVLHLAMTRPGTKIGVFSQTLDSSIANQQKDMVALLPPNYRRQEFGTCKYSWSDSNGFYRGLLQFANGSFIKFFSYSQQIDVVEGRNFDVVWSDENVPVALYSTMAMRVADTAHGQRVLSLTPIAASGYTPLVNAVMAGAKTVQSEFVEFLALECPRLMESRTGNPIPFFHVGDNPFVEIPKVHNQILGYRTKSERVVRFAGYVEQISFRQFPAFDKAKHVTPPPPKTPTSTEVLTVHLGRDLNSSWYLLRLRIEDGKAHALAEFPDGEWAALNSSGLYEAGEGQRLYSKLSIDSWAKKIKEFAPKCKRFIFDQSLQNLEKLAKEPAFSRLKNEIEMALRRRIVVAPKTYRSDQTKVINSYLSSGRLTISEGCKNLLAAIEHLDEEQKNEHSKPLECTSNGLAMLARTAKFTAGRWHHRYAVPSDD